MQKPDFQYLGIYEEGLTQPEKYDIIESDVVELAKELEKCAYQHLMYSAARGLERWAEMDKPRNIKSNWKDWQNPMKW